MNTYIPKFVPKDLPWYERNGLMIWYDQGQCEDFLRDSDKYFREAKIINFDIIQRECRGEEVPKDLLQYYQTVRDKSVSEYPASDQDKIVSSAFRTDRKDIFFEQQNHKKTF